MNKAHHARRALKGAMLTATALILSALVAGCSAPGMDSVATDSSAADPNQLYLTAVREAGAGTVIIPDLDDEKLLGAGRTICQLYDNQLEEPDFNTAEAVRTDIRNYFSPIPELSGHPDGFQEERIIAAGAVIPAATTHLCPQHKADAEREFASLAYVTEN